MEWLGWVILLIILWLTIGRGVMHGLKNDTSTSDTGLAPALDWPPLGEFDFDIVGESYYQDNIRKLAGDHGDQSPQLECHALLVPDPNNRHDRNAVRVDIGGQTVGHLSQDDAPRFRRRLGANKVGGQVSRCSAMIVGGFRMKNGDRAHYGVKLDIKPFDD